MTPKKANTRRLPSDLPSDLPSKQPRVIKLTAPLKDSTEASFFLVVNPGLEKQAEKELRSLLKTHASSAKSLVKNLSVGSGGIQFDSTFGVMRRIQPKLRIASRALIRVDQFGARDFQKLFRKVSNISWEDWLQPKVGLSVRAASHGSRLRIKAGIEEAVVDAFKKSFRAPPPRPTRELLCLVRVEDDICTISLDLSGDLLHQRGTHTDVGRAPLRETWAASIVDQAFEIVSRDEDLKKKFLKSWQWIEPMAGTAVFLREALGGTLDGELAKTSKESGAREFAIDTCFKFEKSPETEELSQAVDGADETSDFRTQVLSHLSTATIIDKDSSQLERAKKALAELSKGALKRRPGFEIEFLEVGGFEKKSSSKNLAENLAAKFVVVNPPWGERLKGAESMDSSRNQEKLMIDIERTWSPDLVAIVFPRIAEKGPKVPASWTEHRPLDFRVGGIPVKARFFTVLRANQEA